MLSSILQCFSIESQVVGYRHQWWSPFLDKPLALEHIGKVTDGVHFQQIFMLAKAYHRSRHQRCSLENAFLKNFAKFTGIHRGQTLFLKHLIYRAPPGDFRYQNCDL